MDEIRLVPAFLAVLRRDLSLALRAPGELANPVIFFVMIASLFPLAVSAASETLRQISPGVIWVAALLASLISMEQLFRGDFEDGTLEQFALAPQPLAVLVLAKLCAHWLITGLPLVIVSPLLALFMHYPWQALPQLMAGLALGTPVLGALGAVGLSLTVGVRRGGLLLALLVLPLYVPVLIFGAGSADAAASGLGVTGQLELLGAMAALALTLAPLAAAAGLRISLD
ncbi:Heme exporter protein B [wastewater metagenome]|uniref:Heme exporter protein B n=2 Tax=unclassified sequences TaxID=12908 RepID=A0A5B8RBU2_9ZZZZ|nr:heme exporter protein CcmB [Arhodomonas aquaeolei]QEA04157.1 heme exporter protein B [uncultured organism]